MWIKVDTLTGDHAMEFATAVIEPICDIASDADAADIFYTHELPEGKDADEFTEMCLRKSIPQLLKKHKDSLIKIFAANQNITVEEYTEKSGILQLSADLASMISDPGMRLFFGFAQPKLK